MPQRTLTVVQQVRITTNTITAMKLHWKLLAIELVLEIVLELGPASLSLMANVAEYLVELSVQSRKASIQLIINTIGHNTARRGPIIDLAQ